MIIKNGKRLDGFCVDSLPIGTLQPFLGLKAPNGYLICDGSLISKTVYPDLYAICGSLFGTETNTHFYLPDLRGKTIAGYNADDSTLNTIGKLLGAISHTHTSAAHTHTVAGHTHTSAAHSHTSAAHSHTTGNHTLTIAEMPSHSHRTYISHGGSSGGVNVFDLAITGVTNNPQWSASTQQDNTGGGGAHNHGNTGSTTPGNTGSTTPGATGSTSLTTDSTTPGATGTASNYQPTMVANWIVKAKMIVPITAIVENNLNSASETNALSAAQGKILDNKKINKELPVYLNDLDNINETGFIYADSASTNKPTAVNGYVMTMRLDDNYLKQVFYNNSSEANVYERVKYAGTWEPWKQTGPMGHLIKTQSVATPSISGVAGTEYEGYVDINVPEGYSVLSVCPVNTSNSDKNFVSYNLFIQSGVARIYYMINCRYSNTDLDTRFLIYYIKTS